MTTSTTRTQRSIEPEIELEPVPVPAREHARFLRRLLVLALAAIVLVGAVNWLVDPTGVTGRTTRWQIADNSAVRTKKVDLYLALDQQPDVVFVGSSRTMKFEPSHVTELTGLMAFNAAVSGGVPRDILQFTRMIAAEHGDDFPHLVWGLDVDSFRNNELRSNLAADPRLSRYVPLRQRVSQSVAKLGVLVEWQTTKATFRALRRGVVDDPGARSLLATRTYADDGFQEWELPRREPGEELDTFVRNHARQYRGFVFERDGYARIEDEPRDDFVATIRIANANGDTPTIMLAPYHPIASELLDDAGMADRTRDVRDMLDRVRDEDGLEFEVVDLSDLASFDGDPDGFYDAVHMTTDNTRRMIDVLHARGAFALEQ